MEITKVAYFKIIDASIEDLGVFKRCSKCGRVFKTAFEFFSETDPVGEENWDGHFLIFRNCFCGSTLTIELFNRDEGDIVNVKK